MRVIGAVVMLAASAAGCRTYSCDAPPSGTGDSIPPLEVPAGLEPPDTRNALKIPELAEPEPPRTEADECLDAPPSYFPDRRVGQPAPSE